MAAISSQPSVWDTLQQHGTSRRVFLDSCAKNGWSGATSWPIGSGQGCIGYSEADFWDDGPFYGRLPHIPLPGIEATVEKIGIEAAAVATAGVAAHLASLAFHREKGDEKKTDGPTS